jgi:hypothetical protein
MRQAKLKPIFGLINLWTMKGLKDAPPLKGRWKPDKRPKSSALAAAL